MGVLAGFAGEAMSSRLVRGWVLMALVGLNGCYAGPEMVSAPVTGYNHTSAEIMRFTINGAGGPGFHQMLAEELKFAVAYSPFSGLQDLERSLSGIKTPIHTGPLSVTNTDKY